MALSVKQASDREKMASEIEQVAAEVGAKAIRQLSNIAPRRITVFIQTPRGLCVYVDFDGDAWNPDVYVLPYHISLDSDATLSDHFGIVAGGKINPHHRHKCTVAIQGFDYLKLKLKMALESAMNGTAFQNNAKAA